MHNLVGVTKQLLVSIGDVDYRFSFDLRSHDIQESKTLEIYVQRPRLGHCPDQLHDPAVLPVNATTPYQRA